MKRFNLKKLNHHGFDHVLIAVGFVVFVGLVGSLYLMLNNASGTYYDYHIGGSNYCLNNEGDTKSSGGYVVIWGCKTTDQASQWTRNGSLIQSAAGDVCLDDWGQSKVNGGGNWVRLYTCNPSDRAQQWSAYGNNQFRNAASGLCLDDWRANYSQGNEVDQYTCKTSGATNQEWDPQSVGSTTGGGSGGGGGTTGYQNPLRDVSGLTFERIDQGVDFGGSGPVYAVGPGRIEGTVNNPSSGWPPGYTFIRYQLTSGAATGLYIYVAEECTPNTGSLSFANGESVNSSTKLCTMYGGSGIETGIANPPQDGTTAAANGASGATSYGNEFYALLKQWGYTP